MLARLGTLLIMALAAGACSDTPQPLPLEVTASVGGSQGVSGSVTGSAHFTFFPPPTPPGLGLRKLGFSAVKHRDGSVSGEWQIVVGATILHGSVDCLTILPGGNEARLSGVVEKAMITSFLPGTAFALRVVDNGQGASSEADELTGLLAFRNAPPEVGRAFCEDGVEPSPLQLMAIEKGNFQVHAN